MADKCVIRTRWVIEWRWPRLRREFVEYPTIETPQRPADEYAAADPNRIAEWRDGEQSDNLSTRKESKP